MSLHPDTGSVELAAYCHYVSKNVAGGVRLDGRGFADIRCPHIAKEVSGPASGATSAIGTSGGTPFASVLYTDDAGSCISCDLHGVFGPPRTESPEEGRLNVHVSAPFMQDHGSLSSHDGFSNVAISNGLADLPLRQVEGYVLEVLKSCLDLGQLLIYPGEACWVLTVNLTLMNIDGSIPSAAVHAAVAAFEGLTLPRALLPNGDTVERRAIHLDTVPVSCTYGVLGGSPVLLLADPTAAEEKICDGIYTVALDEQEGIVQSYHVGQYPLRVDTLVEAMGMLRQVAPNVRRQLRGIS